LLDPFGKSGEIATNRCEDQEAAALALQLLQNSLVLINTLMLQSIPDASFSLRMTHMAMDFRRGGSPYVLSFTVVQSATAQDVLRRPDETTWAEWDQHGRLAYTAGGSLFARAGALPEAAAL
jgi:hypothetical protein